MTIQATLHAWVVAAIGTVVSLLPHLETVARITVLFITAGYTLFLWVLAHRKNKRMNQTRPDGEDKEAE